MRILLIDAISSFLDFGLRCEAAGHEVRLYQGPLKDGSPSPVAKGLLTLVDDWRPSMKWADLILTSDNVKYIQELDGWRARGFPLWAPTAAGRDWELERGTGQRVFESHGIACLPSTVFSNYDHAIAYLREHPEKRFVSKPTGDADKALSYVSKSSQDLLFMLEHWKRTQKRKVPFLFQEFTPGIEMAVGGWVGRSGFLSHFLENFEFKKLMPGEIGVNCFSADTEILTKRGWKLFSDVTLDDEFCSHDAETGTSFWEKAEKIHWTHYKGEMLNFKSRYLDLLVTPTHNMLVKRRKTTQWKVVPANQCPSEFAIPQVGRTTAPDYGDIHLPDGTIVPADAWMRLMGLFLSEGCVDKDRPRTTIYQNPGAKQDIMLQALLSTGLPWYVNGNRISVTHEGLADYLRQFGLSHDKFIPKEVFEASARQIDLFLEAFNLGDGDDHGGRRRYCSGSQALIGGLQALMFLVGKAGAITVDTRTTMVNPINGKTYAAQPVYFVEESGRTEVGMRGDQVQSVPYDGMIGCVTLSTTHLIVVRRNGRVAVTHNTGEMGTAMRYVTAEQSKLAREMLLPLEAELIRQGYTGYIDVAVIIDKRGRPWPLEFTSRPGWPLFQIQQVLHPDPCEWMLDALKGRDTFRPFDDIALGVVMAMPDFPYSHLTRKEVTGFPLWGVNERNRYWLHPCEMQAGRAPVLRDGKLVEEPILVTAGDYVCVVTGCGRGVSEAKDHAYSNLKQFELPNSPIYRNDIGARLEKQLPELQSLGYAEAWSWG